MTDVFQTKPKSSLDLTNKYREQVQFFQKMKSFKNVCLFILPPCGTTHQKS